MVTVGGARKKKGFTIVELLIVIVVIAILAAISIVAYNGIQQRARDSRRLSDSQQIAKGLIMWSLGTGKAFAQMNSGASGNSTGWYDGNYGGGSVQTILQTGEYVSKGIDDPRRDMSSGNRWRYMIVPCVDDAADNRRIVMIELEQTPSQSISQQSASMGCNSGIIAGYASAYKVNYMQMADAR